MVKEKLLEDFRQVKSNCWGLLLFNCYVPKKEDSPVELIEEDDCWMVVVPEQFGCPDGFEELSHYSDSLGFYGKDFPTLEEAIQAYWEVFEKIKKKELIN